MPWCEWWQTTTTGDLWPLLVAVTVHMLYYLVGVARMLAGYGPWGCTPPEADVPCPTDDSEV